MTAHRPGLVRNGAKGFRAAYTSEFLTGLTWPRSGSWQTAGFPANLMQTPR